MINYEIIKYDLTSSKDRKIDNITKLKFETSNNKKYKIEKTYNNTVYTNELKLKYLLNLLKKTFLLLLDSHSY